MMARLLTGMLLCAICACSIAQTPRPGAAWFTAGHVLLGITEPGIGLSGSWQFDQAGNGDTRVIKDEQRMGTTVRGTVLAICDNRALLLKDLQPGKGPATNEIDGPIQLLQLALRLLDRGLPQGPQALTGEAAIDASDDANPIKVKSSNSSGEFLAPWQVRGKVARNSPDKIAFDLTFAYTTPAARGRRLEMSLVGLWQQQSRMPVFANDMPVADWKVYRIDPAARTVSGVALIESRVVPQTAGFGTLGELRRRIEHGWQANPRARKLFECSL